VNDTSSANAPRPAVTFAFWCGFSLIAGVALLGFIKPLLLIGRIIPLDPNEGWNAYFGKIALEGGTLYPPATSLISNNYPPLSFYVVGGVGHLLGDNIIAGRIIALLSLLFVAWGIYYTLRQAGCIARTAALGAVTFLAYAVTYGRDYVAMNDPQWLAHATMIAGLAVLWSGKPTTRTLLVSSILMIAGGWIKHLLLPLPVATGVWLLWRSRPAFWTWALCAAAVMAGAAVVAWKLYGMAFFHSLNFPREYNRYHALIATKGAIKCFAPLLGLSLFTLTRVRERDRLVLIILYLVLASLIGAYASGGVGVDVNCFFDVVIAATMAAAAGIDLLWRHQSGGGASVRGAGSLRYAASAVTLLLALCVAGYAAALAPQQLEGIRQIDALEQAATADIRVIAHEGQNHVGCEMPALCYWANTPFRIDFFYFGQKLKKGLLPSSACADVFTQGNLPLLQLDANLKHRAELLLPECNDIIARNYAPIRSSVFGTLVVFK
jgi:hypothetical protein